MKLTLSFKSYSGDRETRRFNGMPLLIEVISPGGLYESVEFIPGMVFSIVNDKLKLKGSFELLTINKEVLSKLLSESTLEDS